VRGIGHVEIENGIAVCVDPEAIAAKAHKERYRLIGVVSFDSHGVSGFIPENRMDMIQAVEALAEAVVVAEIPDRKHPFADRRGFGGDFVDARRERLYPERLLVDCGSVEQKAVQHEIFGCAARVRNGEFEFGGGCGASLRPEPASRESCAPKGDKAQEPQPKWRSAVGGATRLDTSVDPAGTSARATVKAHCLIVHSGRAC
jgi:hypothetical protein